MALQRATSGMHSGGNGHIGRHQLTTNWTSSCADSWNTVAADSHCSRRVAEAYSLQPLNAHQPQLLEDDGGLCAEAAAATRATP